MDFLQPDMTCLFLVAVKISIMKKRLTTFAQLFLAVERSVAVWSCRGSDRNIRLPARKWKQETQALVSVEVCDGSVAHVRGLILYRWCRRFLLARPECVQFSCGENMDSVNYSVQSYKHGIDTNSKYQCELLLPWVWCLRRVSTPARSLKIQSEGEVWFLTQYIFCHVLTMLRHSFFFLS